MTDHIALDGHRSAVRRMELLAGTGGVRVRRGEGWFAVASGAASNDLNGVVSAAGAPFDEELVDELLAWLGECGGPASWLFTDAVADPRVLGWLIDRGGQPERSGNWAGRSLDLGVPETSRGLTVEPVGDDAAPGRWVDVAVLGAARRRGVGRTLLTHQLDAAVTAGATRAVLAPSQEGWLLARSVGFRLGPVVPDACCYLPSPGKLEKAQPRHSTTHATNG